MIREAGGFPMEIRPVRPSRDVSGKSTLGSAFLRYFVYPYWTGISLRSLLFFYRQLTTMLSAGMSLSEALRGIGQRARGPMGHIVRKMHSHVQSGGRLSDEMSRHTQAFGPLDIALIRAGEQSGLLEPMADRVASHIESEITLRRRVITALLYPCLILLLIFFFPALIALVVHGAQAGALVMWAQFQMIGIPILVILIVCRFLFQFKPVRCAWDVVKIQPPVLGTMARKIAMSRFSKTLALMYSSGVPIAQAVSISADACANIAIGGSIKKVIPALNNGQSLAKSLQETGMMLPEVVDMLDIGEKTGSYDETLQKIAEYMDDETKTTLRKLPIVLFVLMMVIAGMLTYLTVLGGYTSYINQVYKLGSQ